MQKILLGTLDINTKNQKLVKKRESFKQNLSFLSKKDTKNKDLGKKCCHKKGTKTKSKKSCQKKAPRQKKASKKAHRVYVRNFD